MTFINYYKLLYTIHNNYIKKCLIQIVGALFCVGGGGGIAGQLPTLPSLKSGPVLVGIIIIIQAIPNSNIGRIYPLIPHPPPENRHPCMQKHDYVGN